MDILTQKQLIKSLDAAEKREFKGIMEKLVEENKKILQFLRVDPELEKTLKHYIRLNAGGIEKFLCLETKYSYDQVMDRIAVRITEVIRYRNSDEQKIWFYLSKTKYEGSN